MAADYLISSLPTVPFDGPAPITMPEFLARCRAELGYEPLSEGDTRATARKWRDLDTQMRNAAAAERAKALGVDAGKYRRAASGCSLYWQNRMASAFSESDPLKRQNAIDKIYWDATEELVPAASPLSAAAAYAYRIRLEIAERRASVSAEEGNKVFDGITTTP